MTEEKNRNQQFRKTDPPTGMCQALPIAMRTVMTFTRRAPEIAPERPFPHRYSAEIPPGKYLISKDRKSLNSNKINVLSNAPNSALWTGIALPVLRFTACLLYTSLTHQYGLASHQYMYFYYYSESLLCVFLYFVIMGFYKEVFKEMNVSKHVRTATLVVLAGTMFFSYLVVRNLSLIHI